MIAHPQPYAQSRGVAMIAVLWLIAILGMAAMIALRVISFDMELATAKIHGSRASQFAEMGIAVGSNPAVKRIDPILHLQDESAGGGFDVKIYSEGSRFNINSLLLNQDTDLLRDMFIGWGLELEVAQAVTDSLADWVDPDDEARLTGAELEWYEEQGRLNQPFNRPFFHLDEVRLVRGMEIVEMFNPNWQSWFTIWSGGKLDLNDAAPDLIAAATGTTVEMASLISEMVRGPDGVRDTEDDTPFGDVNAALDLLGLNTSMAPQLAGRLTVNDTTTRIESTGYTADAKRRITVIVRNRSGNPALLERFEEIIP
jgi:hypothetical protein